MKRKLMKYAMLYIAELAKEVFPDDETMTPEKFMEFTQTELVYEKVQNGSRIDATLAVVLDGEIQASFTFNIIR